MDDEAFVEKILRKVDHLKTADNPEGNPFTPERAKYNRQNKKSKGTYLKNRAHWEANIYPYTEEGFYDMIRNF